jgi:hypothetical protein
VYVLTRFELELAGNAWDDDAMVAACCLVAALGL